MRISEITEGVTAAWKRTGTKNTRQFRCKSGPRKGRVMASPASCNKPINSKKRASLIKTKTRLGNQRKFKSKQTRKRNPYSRRLKKLNK
jgi:hypothetical protein